MRWAPFWIRSVWRSPGNTACRCLVHTYGLNHDHFHTRGLKNRNEWEIGEHKINWKPSKHKSESFSPCSRSGTKLPGMRKVDIFMTHPVRLIAWKLVPHKESDENLWKSTENFSANSVSGTCVSWVELDFWRHQTLITWLLRTGKSPKRIFEYSCFIQFNILCTKNSDNA